MVGEDRPEGELPSIDISRELDQVLERARTAEQIDSEELQRGLAALVLTLVETIRDLMERQALRRMERGTLTDEETERLGRAFIELREALDELKERFGLEDEDLTLDLGPLGRLR
jgi:hypothetical protein